MRWRSFALAAGLVLTVQSALGQSDWPAQPATGAALVSLTTRPGVESGYWWIPKDRAVATVLLLSGGVGGFPMRDGQPRSTNFLVRNRDEFARAGFNVAILANASDLRQLNPDLRTTPEHMADISAVVQHVRARSNAPLWLIGTSQGSVSAASAALALGPHVAGLVLTASYMRAHASYSSSVTQLPLEKIAVPVLVHHNRDDACPSTPVSLARSLGGRMKAAPVVHYIEVQGGATPAGPACEPLHYHGYFGLDSLVVHQISEWIKSPRT